MTHTGYREVPYNYTSADDKQIVSRILGEDTWHILEKLRKQRVTGKSARLLMRFIGDLFILKRNPFIYQDLIDSSKKRKNYFAKIEQELSAIENAALNGQVLPVIKKCRKVLRKLKKELSDIKKKRKDIEKIFGSIVGRENVYFDPFTINSHATDATDWRMCLPFAVTRPYLEEQVPLILKAAEALNMYVIPRGAGTGLTGGAVPLRENCIIINTEKLTKIHGIEKREFTSDEGDTKTMPVLKLEAGVIADRAMAYAKEHNLVFATDPTSSWACTIGGNISENAGGKKAVLWGTCIDNVLDFKVAMPGGAFRHVERTDHKMRKIIPSDTVTFKVTDTETKESYEIKLKGSEIRKPGLWKDITNKTLGGVPGLQKEGCDGIITSAAFILYKDYDFKTTCCLEFFGENMDEASIVISELSKLFQDRKKEALMALEHFDDEYIKAINYKVKAPKSEIPKAVLLIDIVGHTKEELHAGKEKLSNLLKNYANTEIFFAADEKEAEKFWGDRKKFGAISARTNAFKLNEDVVLPIEALADFARYIDDYNREENRYNQIQIVKTLSAYIKNIHTQLENKEWMDSKFPELEKIGKETISFIENAENESLEHENALSEFTEKILALFTGDKNVQDSIEKVKKETRDKRITIATHMHAGDGNNHVNIPVFSNDVEMMARAHKTADDIMLKTMSLGGVVSGEHGIGITKIKHLSKEEVERLNSYRKKIDPKAVMNPDKLSDQLVHEKVFTPSFNLLGLEAAILQYGSLKILAEKISACVRCCKCKPDCCVFYPDKNMFYHPRNKNLAIAAIIEAILYDAQRAKTGSKFNTLKYLEEIGDHCTICHKCYSPCPVNIDTGEVSILEREILTSLDYKHTPIGTKTILKYLKSRNPIINTIFKKTFLVPGVKAQNMAKKSLDYLRNKIPVKINPLEKDIIKKSKTYQVFQSEAALPSKQSIHSFIPECRENQAVILHPEIETDKTVFYFPGCGSERLFGHIAMASVYSLLKTGKRVVLPPPYLCCGFPLNVNGKDLDFTAISLRNTIIFNQINEMLGYLKFDAFIVSCGTCMEALKKIDSEKIFNTRLVDITEYLYEEGDIENKVGKGIYHKPCHDSMNGKAIDIISDISKNKIRISNSCCSEAGTMSISRPDITNSMLHRKKKNLQGLKILEKQENLPVYTNCPSCIQGLSRNRSAGFKPVHFAVAIAESFGGKEWKKSLKELTSKSEIVNF
ncbi:MAG: FAD-linked oxidase [Deltaproteobacteria bacterium]|nr:MAG: FAD-linked oxidase [Deltaproteobacteria bacterium]